MQLNKTSDYAIRTVLYLAMNKDRYCTAGEIEQSMGVPAAYLYKVTAKLQKAGIIQTLKGNGGGYHLCRQAEMISLYDILSLSEQSLEINGCLVNEDFCSRHATKTCPVRRVYQEITETLHESLQSMTIGKLLEAWASTNNLNIYYDNEAGPPASLSGIKYDHEDSVRIERFCPALFSTIEYNYEDFVRGMLMMKGEKDNEKNNSIYNDVGHGGFDVPAKRGSLCRRTRRK